MTSDLLQASPGNLTLFQQSHSTNIIQPMQMGGGEDHRSIQSCSNNSQDKDVNKETEEEKEMRILKIRNMTRQFNEETVTDAIQRFDILIELLSLGLDERNEKDIRTIGQLLLDFKYFVSLAVQRQGSDPTVMLEIARCVELITFKPSDIIAMQDQVQEKPLFLM